MFIVYNLIYFLFIIFYLPVLIFRRKFHKDIFMRLGAYPKDLMDKLSGKKHIWIHAVSVGEAKAASRLVRELKSRFSADNLVISTVTATGNKIAKSIADKDDAVIYLPLEFGFIIKRAIDLINPSVFITIETELWPKLINQLHKRGVPVVVVNGRISLESFKGYKIIKIFMKSILEKIDLFCMQTNQDAERIIELGAPVEKVKVTGNIKFDFQIPDSNFTMSDLGLDVQDSLLLAGSTHENEEEIILNIYKSLVREFKRLKLLIAPRHIERVGQIEKLIREQGFNPLKVSQIKDGLPEGGAKNIYLLDTIGQLQALYNSATIVFVGGSLIKKGGHNIIEPALFAKPIFIGSYMHNFQDITNIFRNAEAVIQVNNQEELEEKLREFLGDPTELDRLGTKAKLVVKENTGALQKTFDLINNFLK